MKMEPLDYGRSFLIGNGPENEVRFWVESRTRVIDEERGTEEDYLQCASCKSEDTFASRDLFQADNYDFLPVFGPAWGVVFRRKAYLYKSYRETRPADAWWNGQKQHLITGPADLLQTNLAIREATYSHAPIVAQIEIVNKETKMRAIIECPIKTMNTNRGDDLYQVDTGPIMLPDLRRHDRSVDGLRLAYFACNVPDFADFVVEVPTPICEDGEGADVGAQMVHHFSEILSLPTENRLYSINV